MRLNFSYHAKEMQRERGISTDEVIDTIRKGSKIRQDEKIRAETGVWVVAFKKAKDAVDKFFILTVSYKK